MGVQSIAARRALLTSGLAGWALALSAAASLAQGIDCARLQSEIAAVRGNPSAAARYAAAARSQAQQIARTVGYARSIGCENRQFLFFGSPPPRQCPAINDRVRRMQANLQRLQEQAAQAGGAMERRDLRARYDRYCNGGSRASYNGPQNFFERLFGGGGQPTPREIPINPAAGAQPAGPPSGVVRAGSKAVCVRMSDGGFFPVSYTATRSQFPQLEEQCKALCPNVPTKLYTLPQDGVIEQAVSVDGAPYTSLPNASLFEKKYNPDWLCRPPNESWAQALAGAAKLNAPRATDIVVTGQRSTEIAAQSRANQTNGAGSATPDYPPDAASADIDGSMIKGKFFGLKAGVVKEEAGADGIKRPVRIVGPKT